MEKIKELRKKNGMTQQQLSEILGVTRTTIANWELGICSPNLTYVVRMAHIFDVTTDELLEPIKIENNT